MNSTSSGVHKHCPLSPPFFFNSEFDHSAALAHSTRLCGFDGTKLVSPFASAWNHAVEAYFLASEDALDYTAFVNVMQLSVWGYIISEQQLNVRY